MLQNKSKLVETLVGLLIAIIAIYAIYLLISQIIDVFGRVNGQYGAALVAAAATIIVSVVSVIFSRHLEARAIIQREHREKKIPVYEGLLELMSRITLGEKTGEELSEVEKLQLLRNLTQKLTIWASDEVLRAFVAFRRSAVKHSETNPSDADTIAFLLSYETLLFAVRKDLKHENHDIQEGDLLSLFVNDIENHLQMIRSQPGA